MLLLHLIRDKNTKLVLQTELIKQDNKVGSIFSLPFSFCVCMWRRETWSFKFEWTHPIHRYCISVWTVSHSFLVVLQKCPGIVFVFLFHCFFSLHSTPLWMKNYLQHWIAKFKITVLKLKVTISSVDLTANSNSTIASFLQLEKKKKSHTSTAGAANKSL